MELRHLRYFVAVAEELNFTRAAKRVHTAQPSLSQQVKQLEEYLGTKLLERNKRRVELTAAGRVFLRESRDILQRIQQAVDLTSRVAQAKAGEISIGVSPPAEVRVVPKLLPLLANRMPDVALLLHRMSSTQQIAGLRNYSIDVGFLRGPLDEPDITAEEIFREKIIVVMPSSHRLAKVRRVSIRMLDDLPCITISRGAGQPLRDVLASLYKQARMQVRTAQEADGVLGHLSMVAAGLGFALLPEYVKSILPRGVVTKPLDWHPIPSISLVAAYRTGDELPALGVLLEVLRGCFSKPGQATPRPRLDSGEPVTAPGADRSRAASRK